MTLSATTDATVGYSMVDGELTVDPTFTLAPEMVLQFVYKYHLVLSDLDTTTTMSSDMEEGRYHQGHARSEHDGSRDEDGKEILVSSTNESESVNGANTVTKFPFQKRTVKHGSHKPHTNHLCGGSSRHGGKCDREAPQ